MSPACLEVEVLVGMKTIPPDSLTVCGSFVPEENWSGLKKVSQEAAFPSQGVRRGRLAPAFVKLIKVSKNIQVCLKGFAADEEGC